MVFDQPLGSSTEASEFPHQIAAVDLKQILKPSPQTTPIYAGVDRPPSQQKQVMSIDTIKDLVGGIPTPLKNVKLNWEKCMFQTTNQGCL